MSRRKCATVDLGDQLRAMRVASGLSQRAVARLVHVAPNTVTHWETGHRCPALPDLDAYLRVVGGSITLGVAA
jgi:DNA-binding transcriptional regulator YiaG